MPVICRGARPDAARWMRAGGRDKVPGVREAPEARRGEGGASALGTKPWGDVLGSLENNCETAVRVEMDIFCTPASSAVIYMHI